MSGEHKANNPDEARRAERIFFKKKEGEKRMDRIEHLKVPKSSISFFVLLFMNLSLT